MKMPVRVAIPRTQEEQWRRSRTLEGQIDTYGAQFRVVEMEHSEYALLQQARRAREDLIAQLERLSEMIDNALDETNHGRRSAAIGEPMSRRLVKIQGHQERMSAAFHLFRSTNPELAKHFDALVSEPASQGASQ